MSNRKKKLPIKTDDKKENGTCISLKDLNDFRLIINFITNTFVPLFILEYKNTYIK